MNRNKNFIINSSAFVENVETKSFELETSNVSVGSLSKVIMVFK